ncbi:amidohydrolase family protein [Acidobacteria bacterium AH-259-D05]|nr:amidohydrolase family protein [Acidobacteria bacterium AH-259-D05]
MKNPNCLFKILFVSLLSPILAYAQTNFPEEYLPYADLVVYNGKVLTVNQAFAVAEAVAVREGKFQAVGESRDILRLAGPRTRKIDLQGKMVVPGFIDTHLHQASIGNRFTLGVEDLGAVKFTSIDSGLIEVKELVDQVKPGEWVVVRGPFNGNEAINNVTRWQLDTVSADNPIAILYAGEMSVVNSKGWDSIKMPVTMPGILKDENGRPTGQLRLGAHGYLTYEFLPWPVVDDELLNRQVQQLKTLNDQGLTTVVGRASGLALTIHRELAVRGLLTMRIRISHEFARSNGEVERFLKRIGNLVGFNMDEMVKVYSVTVQHPDGISGAGAALTFRPKLRHLKGDPYGTFGHNRWEDDGLTPEESDRLNILLAIKYGWPVSGVHSVGDKATNMILRAYEEASGNSNLVPLAGRLGIDHQAMQVPENLEIMKKLGVIPSVYFLTGGGREPTSLVYQYGADAVNKMTAVKTMVDLGLKPVIEADTTRFPYSAPLWNLERFITRTDEKGKVWGLEEKVSRQITLRMYTSWAAEYCGDGELLGSIERGKLADFVVLGEDYLTVPENEIAEIPVLMTVVGGRVVYENPQLSE